MTEISEKENEVLTKDDDFKDAKESTKKSENIKGTGAIKTKTLADLIGICRDKGYQVYNDMPNIPEADRLRMEAVGEQGGKDKKHSTDPVDPDPPPLSRPIKSERSSLKSGYLDADGSWESSGNTSALGSVYSQPVTRMSPSQIKKKTKYAKIDTEEVLQQRMRNRSRRRRENRHESLIDVVNQLDPSSGHIRPSSCNDRQDSSNYINSNYVHETKSLNVSRDNTNQGEENDQENDSGIGSDLTKLTLSTKPCTNNETNKVNANIFQGNKENDDVGLQVNKTGSNTEREKERNIQVLEHDSSKEKCNSQVSNNITKGDSTESENQSEKSKMDNDSDKVVDEVRIRDGNSTLVLYKVKEKSLIGLPSNSKNVTWSTNIAKQDGESNNSDKSNKSDAASQSNGEKVKAKKDTDTKEATKAPKGQLSKKSSPKSDRTLSKEEQFKVLVEEARKENEESTKQHLQVIALFAETRQSLKNDIHTGFNNIGEQEQDMDEKGEANESKINPEQESDGNNSNDQTEAIEQNVKVENESPRSHQIKHNEKSLKSAKPEKKTGVVNDSIIDSHEPKHQLNGRKQNAIDEASHVSPARKPHTDMKEGPTENSIDKHVKSEDTDAINEHKSGKSIEIDNLKRQGNLPETENEGTGVEDNITNLEKKENLVKGNMTETDNRNNVVENNVIESENTVNMIGSENRENDVDCNIIENKVDKNQAMPEDTGNVSNNNNKTKSGNKIGTVGNTTKSENEGTNVEPNMCQSENRENEVKNSVIEPENTDNTVDRNIVKNSKTESENTENLDTLTESRNQGNVVSDNMSKSGNQGNADTNNVTEFGNQENAATDNMTESGNQGNAVTNNMTESENQGNADTNNMNKSGNQVNAATNNMTESGNQVNAVTDNMTESENQENVATDNTTESGNQGNAVTNNMTESQNQGNAVTNNMTESGNQVNAVTDDMTESGNQGNAVTDNMTESGNKGNAVTNNMTESGNQVNAVTNNMTESENQGNAVTNNITESKNQGNADTNNMTKSGNQGNAVTDNMTESGNKGNAVTNNMTESGNQVNAVTNNMTESENQGNAVTNNMSESGNQGNADTNNMTESGNQVNAVTNNMTESENQGTMLTDNMTKSGEQGKTVTDSMPESGNHGSAVTGVMTKSENRGNYKEHNISKSEKRESEGKRNITEVENRVTASENKGNVVADNLSQSENKKDDKEHKIAKSANKRNEKERNTHITQSRENAVTDNTTHSDYRESDEECNVHGSENKGNVVKSNATQSENRGNYIERNVPASENKDNAVKDNKNQSTNSGNDVEHNVSELENTENAISGNATHSGNKVNYIVRNVPSSENKEHAVTDNAIQSNNSENDAEVNRGESENIGNLVTSNANESEKTINEVKADMTELENIENVQNSNNTESKNEFNAQMDTMILSENREKGFRFNNKTESESKENNATSNLIKSENKGKAEEHNSSELDNDGKVKDNMTGMEKRDEECNVHGSENKGNAVKSNATQSENRETSSERNVDGDATESENRENEENVIMLEPKKREKREDYVNESENIENDLKGKASEPENRENRETSSEFTIELETEETRISDKAKYENKSVDSNTANKEAECGDNTLEGDETEEESRRTLKLLADCSFHLDGHTYRLQPHGTLTEIISDVDSETVDTKSDPHNADFKKTMKKEKQNRFRELGRVLKALRMSQYDTKGISQNNVYIKEALRICPNAFVRENKNGKSQKKTATKKTTKVNDARLYNMYESDDIESNTTKKDATKMIITIPSGGENISEESFTTDDDSPTDKTVNKKVGNYNRRLTIRKAVTVQSQNNKDEDTDASREGGSVTERNDTKEISIDTKVMSNRGKRMNRKKFKFDDKVKEKDVFEIDRAFLKENVDILKNAYDFIKPPKSTNQHRVINARKSSSRESSCPSLTFRSNDYERTRLSTTDNEGGQDEGDEGIELDTDDNEEISSRKKSAQQSETGTIRNNNSRSRIVSGKSETTISAAVQVVRSRTEFYNHLISNRKTSTPRGHRVHRLYREIQRIRRHGESLDGPVTTLHESSKSLVSDPNSGFLFLNYNKSRRCISDQKNSSDMNSFLYGGFDYEVCSNAKPLVSTYRRRNKAFDSLRQNMYMKP